MMLVLWVIALVLIVCAALLGGLLLQGSAIGKVAVLQIQALGQTHKLGFEALTITLNSLEARIKKLENGGRR